MAAISTRPPQIHVCARAMLLAATRRRLGAVPCRRRGAQSSAQQGVEAAAQPLLDWLASRGADTAGVRVTNSGDGTGWGLAAARECAAGDLLVSLPPSCTLSYSSDSLAPPLRRLVDAVPPDLWAARLGLVLLSERVRGASRCADATSSCVLHAHDSLTIPSRRDSPASSRRTSRCCRPASTACRCFSRRRLSARCSTRPSLSR